jgi:RNA polymerase sigma-70 factor (ECF subfamily)
MLVSAKTVRTAVARPRIAAMRAAAHTLDLRRSPAARAVEAVNLLADSTEDSVRGVLASAAEIGGLPSRALRSAAGSASSAARSTARLGRNAARAGIGALGAILPKARKSPRTKSPRILTSDANNSDARTSETGASSRAPATSASTDEALVVAHRTGDPTALRTLIERYQSDLHGFLTRLTGSRAAADDVFQETFLQVHLSAESFDAERRFKPWLYTIAANKGRDHLRRQRRRAAASLDAPVGSNGDGALVDLLEGHDDAPAMPLESADEAGIVKSVIDEMPPHFREILLLSYFQRMSYAQIAESLSIPLGTVKSRLHAAVASFADSWKIACARRGVRPDAPGATRDTDSTSTSRTKATRESR